MRKRLALLAAAASLSTLSACGGDGPEGATGRGGEAEALKTAAACLERAAKLPPGSRSPQPERKGLKGLHLTLKGHPDAEDAGILLAAERGYFAAAGLDLHITSPVIADNIPEYLVEGGSDVSILPQPQVTMANSQGMPLVAIGSLIRRPTMAMMALPDSGIVGVADLKGKRVAINSLPFEEAILASALADAGLSRDDVKLRPAGYELVQALIDRRVDAILGVYRNQEGVELEACGVRPVVIPVRKLGVPPYEELDLVARRDRLARSPELFRAFMSALARGTAAAAANPRAAAEAISLYRGKLGVADPQEPALVEAKVKATLPLLSKSGSMDPARATRFATWMYEQGLIQREVPVSRLLTNRLVESAGAR